MMYIHFTIIDQTADQYFLCAIKYTLSSVIIVNSGHNGLPDEFGQGSDLQSFVFQAGQDFVDLVQPEIGITIPPRQDIMKKNDIVGVHLLQNLSGQPMDTSIAEIIGPA